MLAILIALSTPIWALVEFIKSGLVWAGAFDHVSEKGQTVILQLIAGGIGVLVAVSYQINAFFEVPLFASLPLWVAWVATGLAASGGSAFIHLLAAFIGVRVGVVVPVNAAEPKAQEAGTVSRPSYGAWM